MSEWPFAVTLIIQTASFWFDFGNSHYNFTLTLLTDSQSSDGVLYSVSIPTITSSISILKDVFLFENCSQYMVSATSVSPTLGRSTSSEFIFTSPQVGEFVRSCFHSSLMKCTSMQYYHQLSLATCTQCTLTKV